LTPILEIDRISKRYGEVDALREVSLRIVEGELVTLLGPSGSGKSTLLKIIVGALAPTSGRLLLRGEDITSLPARFRGIGIVFQNFALMPHLTAFDNVAFPLQVRRLPRAEIEQRVREALELVQLPDAGNRKPRELSGGQQQRVAIARVLVYRPSVILMDEPLGALDKKLRDQMQLEIKRLHRSLKLSLIYVTHDQEEALTLSDRICLMEGGRIVETAAPVDVYSQPKSRFAADFFGATNIFEGTAEQTGGTVVIRDGDLGVVRALSDAPVQPGRVSWMVRPERVRLLADGESEDNVLEGTVSEIVLSGAVTRLTVQVGKRQLGLTQLTDHRSAGMERGRRVRLGWPASATRLLDA
jgi:ABC-type Fe3+/spermidine/putrescine transport system ATPase subunit